MIEELFKSADGVCVNCGEKIELWKGDLSRDPFWTHADGGLRSCRGAPQAEPSEPAVSS